MHEVYMCLKESNIKPHVVYLHSFNNWENGFLKIRQYLNRMERFICGLESILQIQERASVFFQGANWVVGRVGTHKSGKRIFRQVPVVVPFRMDPAKN